MLFQDETMIFQEKKIHFMETPEIFPLQFPHIFYEFLEMGVLKIDILFTATRQVIGGYPKGMSQFLEYPDRHVFRSLALISAHRRPRQLCA
jgi:hypothetical protein